MSTFGISKIVIRTFFRFLWPRFEELALTLKCFYEKKQPCRNHVETMFAF